jgi:hypothetical protein
MAKKYKQPKNEKHSARKDLKDYTIDKEVEGMVPNASGEAMPEVPRKDDKPVIDDVENMVPKSKPADAVYPIKDMEDGDPKMSQHALKTLVKNQKEDAEELIDTMAKKDGGYMSQIKKLTKEQQEKLVRELVRRKVIKFLAEQEDKEQKDQAEAPEAEAEAPEAEAPEAPETEAPEAEAPEAEVPTPEAPAEPTPAPTPAAEEPEAEEEPAEEEPETDEAPAEEEPEAEEPSTSGDARVENFIKALDQQPNIILQIKMIMSVLNRIMANDDRKQKIGKISLLKRVVDKALQQL